MNLGKKRGLSPVMATILLVAIAIILAVIIFLWARNFLEESITKNDRKVEQSCEDVVFKAEAYNNRLYVENTGTVPIYRVELQLKQVFGDITQIPDWEGTGIRQGETADSALPPEATPTDTIVVMPILLGETDTRKKPHPCGESYGVEIEVE
jgi:flagellin-like protein